MKLFFVGLVLFLIIGCESASDVEVIFAVQELEDFKEIVQVMDISGPFGSFAEVDSAKPELQQKKITDKSYAAHVVIYKTKTGGLRITTLGSGRPPKITTLSQEIKW